MKELETLYRVFDLSNNKYYTTSKKSIWKSERWALNAVAEMCNDRYGRRKANEFEIHTIKQVVESRQFADILLMEKKERECKIEEAKKEIDKIENKICNVVDNLSFSNIQNLFNNKMFSQDIHEQLRPLFSLRAEYKRFI